MHTIIMISALCLSAGAPDPPAGGQVPKVEQRAYARTHDFTSEYVTIKMVTEKGGRPKERTLQRWSVRLADGRIALVVADGDDRLRYEEGSSTSLGAGSARMYLAMDERVIAPANILAQYMLGSTMRNEIVLPHPITDFTYKQVGDTVERVPTYKGSAYEKLSVQFDAEGNLVRIDYTDKQKGIVTERLTMSGYHEVAPGHVRPERLVHQLLDHEGKVTASTTLTFSGWAFDFDLKPGSLTQQSFPTCCPSAAEAGQAPTRK